MSCALVTGVLRCALPIYPRHPPRPRPRRHRPRRHRPRRARHHAVHQRADRRKGAKTGLITTAGFRDVLEIARERKYELYDIFIEMPAALVPRPLRREVPERIGPDRSEEHTSELQSLMRISYAVFCLKNKQKTHTKNTQKHYQRRIYSQTHPA